MGGTLKFSRRGLALRVGRRLARTIVLKLAATYLSHGRASKLARLDSPPVSHWALPLRSCNLLHGLRHLIRQPVAPRPELSRPSPIGPLTYASGSRLSVIPARPCPRWVQIHLREGISPSAAHPCAPQATASETSGSRPMAGLPATLPR